MNSQYGMIREMTNPVVNFGVRCQKATNSKIVVSTSCDVIVDRLFLTQSILPFVTLPQKEKRNTSTFWETTNEIRDAIVIRKDEPNTAAYSDCISHVGLGGIAIHTLIMTNSRTSMTVDMLTNLEASFLPYTSPTMSVIRNITGMKKIPTDTRTPRMVVIFVPNVLTMTIDATNSANRKSRFLGAQ